MIETGPEAAKHLRKEKATEVNAEYVSLKGKVQTLVEG